MVIPVRFVLAAALALGGSAPAKSPSEYRIGDTLEEDLTAPVAFRLGNGVTAAPRGEESIGDVPLIFRYLPGLPEVAETELRDRFARTRTNFLQEVHAVFRHRKLSPSDLAGDAFRQLLSSFARTNNGFPVTTDLAELWAAGDTGRAVQQSALAKLVGAQARFLHSMASPPQLPPATRVLLVTVSNQSQALTLESAETHGHLLNWSNLTTISRARTELEGRFWDEERVMGKFVAGLLRENCFVDAELSNLARERALPHLAGESFAPGQLIARRGQTVDARLKTVLEALAQPTTRVPTRQQTAEDRFAASATTDPKSTERQNHWLLAGFLVATGGVLWLGWWLSGRKRQRTLVPARVAGDGAPATVVSCPSCDETIVVPIGTVSGTSGAWEARACAAEQRAEKARAALRTGALAHFGRWLKEHFAQRLLSERSQMLDAQKTAAAELAEMGRRLDELHAPLQERLRAYEKRVTELEQSLAAMGRENRQLLEAKIQLTRQQLEAERARPYKQFK